MTKRLLAVLVCVLLAASCSPVSGTIGNIYSKIYDKYEKVAIPVDVNAEKLGDATIVTVTAKQPDCMYSYSLDNQNHTLTIDLKAKELRMGTFVAASPVYSADYKKTEDGMSVVLRLGASVTAEAVQTTDKAYVITLKTTGPDADMMSMSRFGPWVDQYVRARHLVFAGNKKGKFVLEFDGSPIYSRGSADGKSWLEIYGVDIRTGMIKGGGVSGVESVKEGTRIYLPAGTEICPTSTGIIIGEKCQGYIGLFSFVRTMENGRDYFTFRATDKPDITIKNAERLSALGMKDVRVFDTSMRTFSGSLVYKMEMRKSDGMVWMVFLHEPEVKLKQSYSDGKVTVVFYK